MIDIKDILEEYDKLKDVSYINDIKLHGIGRYDYKLHKDIKPSDLSFSKNKALIMAIIMLNNKSRNDLLEERYGNIRASFLNYAKDSNIVSTKNSVYVGYNNIENYLKYDLITGITKTTTKKSLSMFNKKIIDKLFEINGILKRNIRKKDNKNLIIDDLNTFTLVMFKKVFKPNTLALTELKRIFKDTGNYGTIPSFTLEWSNAVLKAIKPSKAAYIYIYNCTTDGNAEIFQHIIILGQKSFNTPVENFKRICNIEKVTITTATDLAGISTHYLTKAALEAPTNSLIYKHILKYLKGTKDSLIDYIDNLTAIVNELDY